MRQFLARFTHWNYLLWTAVSALLPLLFSSLILFRLLEKGPEFWLFQQPWLFFLLASAGMGLALTPTTFIALLAGYLFGWSGLIGVLVSYPMAASLGRMIGRALFHRFGLPAYLAQARYQRFLTQLSAQPLRMLIFARLSPILPFAFTNLLLGQVSLPWPTYLLGTILGMIPRTLLVFWAGVQAKAWVDLLQSGTAPSLANGPLLTGGLLLISSLGLSWILIRAWRKSEAASLG